MGKQKENPRTLAYMVLNSVETKEAFADRVLDGTLKKHRDLEIRDRGLTTELVYGILRRRGSLDQCLQAYVKKPLDQLDPPLLQILRIGVYQILFLDRVPDHAAVNEAVNLAHRFCRPGTGGLVNGALRSLCRTKDKKPETLKKHISPGEQDFPGWLRQLWKAELDEDQIQALFSTLLTSPQTILRVNRLKTDQPQLLQRLNEEGFRAEPFQELAGAIRVREGGDIRRAAVYQLGWCLQQDAASQLIVPLLDPQPGERILDLCAAPGIKTSQIAERMENKGLILATDNNAGRLKELVKLSSRLGLTIITPICADGANTASLSPTAADPFDRILVDAPCSGLGVLRRNPERKWRPMPDFASLCRLQAKLLNRAATLLRAGGVLLYSTCTVNRNENEALIEKFLKEHKNFVLEDIGSFLPESMSHLRSTEGYFTSWNEPAGGDLFFAARLRKQ